MSHVLPTATELCCYGANDGNAVIFQRGLDAFSRVLLIASTFSLVGRCASSAPIKQAQQVHTWRSRCRDKCTKLPRKISAFPSFAPYHGATYGDCAIFQRGFHGFFAYSCSLTGFPFVQRCASSAPIKQAQQVHARRSVRHASVSQTTTRIT